MHVDVTPRLRVALIPSEGWTLQKPKTRTTRDGKRERGWESFKWFTTASGAMKEAFMVELSKIDGEMSDKREEIMALVEMVSHRCRELEDAIRKATYVNEEKP